MPDLYEIIFPEKKYIGAKNMEQAVYKYLKINKTAEKVILTNHREIAEFNIIKIKKKNIIKLISKHIKQEYQFQPQPNILSTQMPLYFPSMSMNLGTPSIPVPSPPASNLYPLPNTTNLPPPTPTNLPPPTPAPRRNAQGEIISIPPTDSSIVSTTDIDKIINKDVSNLEICVEYNKKIWKVVNIINNKSKKEKHIVIQELDNPALLFKIPYNSPNTVSSVKTIIRKCIKLLSPTVTTEPEIQFDMDKLAQEITNTERVELDLPEEEEEGDYVTISPSNNVDTSRIHIEEYNKLLRNSIQQLRKNNANEEIIDLFTKIVNILHERYKCMYISEIKKDSPLDASIAPLLEKIIRSDVFGITYFNSLSPENQKIVQTSKRKARKLFAKFLAIIKLSAKSTIIKMSKRNVSEEFKDVLKKKSNSATILDEVEEIYEKCKSLTTTNEETLKIL